jgi:hypothetical protein
MGGEGFPCCPFDDCIPERPVFYGKAQQKEGILPRTGGLRSASQDLGRNGTFGGCSVYPDRTAVVFFDDPPL